MRWTIFALGVLLLAGFASAISADCDSSMIAYWELNGNPIDSFGSNDGSPPWPGTGTLQVGQAASFDGSEVITIDDPDQVLDFHGGGGFTIEFWVRGAYGPTDASLLNKTNYHIDWIVDDFDTDLNHIEATAGVGTDNPATVISGNLASAENYHVALTWFPAQQNLSLYVANTLEDWAALKNPGAYYGPLKIGEGFVGLIDEVALFGRYFSKAEVNFDWATSSATNDYCYAGGGGNISSTRSDFTLAGCQLPDGSSISAGSCSRNGMFYCGNQSLTLYDTLGIYNDIETSTGCSLEKAPYVLGTTQCCPSGYLCGEDPDDGWVCNLRLVECGIQPTRDACDKAGCFWIDGEGCVDNPSDYSCSIYSSEVSCTLDVWNVGAAGIGTEVCGTYFVDDVTVPGSRQGYVIPQDSCKCDWVPDAGGDKCKLGYDVVPDIYGSNPSTFRCQKDFSTEDCIDGKQQINWLSDPSEPQNWPGPIPQAVLDLAGCGLDNGGVSRDCGEPIVKLPAFSFFALMSSLAIIGLFYFFKKE